MDSTSRFSDIQIGTYLIWEVVDVLPHRIHCRLRLVIRLGMARKKSRAYLTRTVIKASFSLFVPFTAFQLSAV